MARPRVKLKWHMDGFDALRTSPGAIAVVNEKAEAVAAACNADSSWGGYDWASANESGGRQRGRARVWSYGSHDSTERVQRMIANLDA